MSTAPATEDQRPASGHPLAGLLWRVRALRIGSLIVLFISSLWSLNEFTGLIDKSLSFSNYETIFTEPIYRKIVWRTVSIAALVTITDIVLAFPIAFYMARVASVRIKALLVVAVLMPLWASYLVKVYSWRTMLAHDGVINWLLDPFGLSVPTSGYIRVWIVMAYLWLPYMILPLYAGLERIPDSLLSASDDLGARPPTTIRRVIWPLVFPAIVAGSIFTFSLTLGDFIAVGLVSKNQFIGTVVYSNITTNLPLAAAFATVPILVMVAYLLIARRLGAFEHV